MPRGSGEETAQAVAGTYAESLLTVASEATRELLRLDVALVGAFDDDAQVYVAVAGRPTLGIAPGGLIPLDESICRRVVAGEAPAAIPDTAAEPAVRDLAVTRRIGAYVGVPIRFSDGSLYGTFCGVGRSPREAIAERDVAFMEVIARVIGAYLEREETVARADAARADVFARVTHDLRSPLTTLLGYGELLRARTGDEDAATIVSEVRRLDRMLTELLEEQTATPVDTATFDVAELAATHVRLLAGGSRHQVELERPARPVVVSGDRMRTGNVLRNLLSNAIKYSPDGGRVTVRVEPRGGTARVSVVDEGVGIPREQAGAIFTRFFRARSDATRTIPGTGLGLALARQSIREQGGTMGFETVEGEGSTFWFELPSS